MICSKFITFAVTKTTHGEVNRYETRLWFAQNSLPLRWQRQPVRLVPTTCAVVICSKFITFAVTKTTKWAFLGDIELLWFAQNSLPLRWQRQPNDFAWWSAACCDLLKIHYLCGDKDNSLKFNALCKIVVICSKFITFAVTKTTALLRMGIDLSLWFAQNSLPLRWQRQPWRFDSAALTSCDLLKIHYLCGDKDNINLVFDWESEECRMF